jgi:acyl transferase domain-containing protein/acyl carrier protein
MSSEIPSNAIAVVGMAGRFPGAADLDRFWTNLRDGVESITFFSEDELRAAGVSDQTLSNPSYVRAKPYMEGIELFDAAFFGFTPREASLLDPQHRIFLECAWEALENAGYDAERFPGRIGVYGGANLSSYMLWNLLSNPEVLASVGGVQGRIGVDKDFLTTQVSYRMNLRGPSFAVQTACSTSLVAVHVASQSLLDGECDMALAGGVGINLPQKIGYIHTEGSIYSPDGHCRAFDAEARGTVLGDGAGVVVLKRLADALDAGDRIRAVIRGSAINNDGSGKIGYTAPSLDAQAEVVAEAIGIAGVEPETIGVVEAHGTGTRLGDPIEVAALAKAFRSRGTARRGFCALGSVKTNIGHLDAAAGVAGLIKTVLALENGLIPPSLGFSKPNPEIDFAGSPFFVNDRLREWPAGPNPRRAGISSLGVGGTNVHAVLEEAPVPAPSGPSRPWQILPLSAKTATALQAASENLAQFLSQLPPRPAGREGVGEGGRGGEGLPDIAFTLQTGRRAFAHRRIIVARDAADAASQLRTPSPDRAATGIVRGGDRPVVFLFPGQGAQHPNMALDLYRGEPVFRQEMDRCAEILQPHLGLDLREVLYPAPGGEEEAARRLERTELTQPALFALEYSLARLWMSWGVRPAAMLGHSVGEYVAACLAGVLPLEDALALIASRGRLIQGLPGGAMLAVPLPEAEVTAHLTPQLALAAVNGPELCVVSGPEEAVEALRLKLDAEKVECTRLHTSHAFHSEMMAPILGPFRERASRVKLAPPRLPYLSNVTGTWIRPEEATDPGYWVRHVRQTVRFADGLAEVLADPERVLLEVGPGQALSTLAAQMPAQNPADRLARVAVPSLRRPKDDPSEVSDLARMLHALGKLWSAGAAVSWESLTASEQRRRVPLPTYPFERQKYWIDPAPRTPVVTSGADGAVPDALPEGGGLSKQALDTWFYLPAWREVERIEPPGDQEKASWLVFVDESGIGQRAVDLLRARGETVRAVVPGNAFEVREDGTIALRPGERKDYDLLMKETRGASPTRALHLWNVTGGAPSGPDRAFWSLLYLVQALGEESPGVPVRIGAVADGLHDVSGGEAAHPEKALALGLCRVVPQEAARMSFRSFDVTVPPAGPAAEALAARLVSELAGGATDPIVAFRGRRRWVQGWEAAPLDARWSHPSILREGGAWLITGGLDPTSLVFARHLVREAKGRVALVVPPGFPTRGSWDALLASSPATAHGRPDPVARAIRTVRELEEQGDEVLLVPADPATDEGAREAVRAVLERFGELRGVLHVDMFPGAGLIQLKTPDASAPVLRPKVEGTRALSAALEGVPIEILVLFSSTIAVTGGLGQVDFCAANNFLDAFAERERAAGRLPAVTLDWGSFRWEEWQEQLGGGPAGMQEELKRSLAVFGIDERESWEAFSRALATGAPRVVVSTGNLDTVIAHHNAMTASLLAQQPGPAAGGGHPRPALSTPYAPPADEIEEGIAGIWQEMLGFEPVGVQDNFFELAGNSLTAIQIITRIRKAFDVDLSMSAIFETPTVSGLAGAVRASRLGSEELAEVDNILDEIEGLSAEELERLLAEEMEMEGGAHGG